MFGFFLTGFRGDAETPLWEDVNVVSDPDAIKRSMVGGRRLCRLLRLRS